VSPQIARRHQGGARRCAGEGRLDLRSGHFLDTAIFLIHRRVAERSPDDPLDFEAAIEGTLLDWKKRFQIVKILFDPWQMMAVSQRLMRLGFMIEEFPQSPGN
jgi:hypothetical protein